MNKLLNELFSFVLYVEEYYDTCDIVDDVLLSFPLLECSSYKIFCCAFCISLQEVRIDDVSYLLVFKELPYAIAGQDDDFVCGAHVVLGDLRHCVDSNAGGHLITEGSTHREAGDILMLKPDALRTNFMPLAVPV